MGDKTSVRVMQVISGRMYGGGQRVVLDLLQAIPRVEDIEVCLCTLGECGNSPLDDARHEFVRYDGRYNRLRVIYATARRLRRIIRRVRPDIVHTHGWDADVIGALAVRGTPAAHVVHLHVTAGWLSSTSVKHRFRRWLTRRLISPRSTSLIAVSEAVKRHWCSHLNWSADAITVVLNGIDAELFRPAHACVGVRDPKRPLIVGTAGRLAPSKGLEDLISAVHGLLGEGRNVELHIAGDGPLRDGLERDCRARGLDEGVRFLGHVHAMAEFYRNLDLFVFPAAADEGLPLSVLEAMACGLPVIATSVAGPIEVVANGRNGLLVAPRRPMELALAIKLLGDAPELCERLGQRAREHVLGCFTMEHMAKGIVAVYHRVSQPIASAV